MSHTIAYHRLLFHPPQTATPPPHPTHCPLSLVFVPARSAVSGAPTGT